jgi:hypothetical protein
MALEHGLELERLKAEEKKTLTAPEDSAGREEEDRSSIRGIYGTVRDLNKNIKDWKGG